jgi:two-component sensor histidine kinase
MGQWASAVRLTAAKRIVFGLAAISVIGILAMLVIYAGLNAVERAVHELAVEEQPFNAAAYEMEVNVNGIGFAVMKYLATREPKYRALVDEDHDDFNKYHATYVRLAKTERERELARQVSMLYAEYNVFGYSLMRTRDRQEAQFTNVSTNLERIYRLIDDNLQPAAGVGRTSNPNRHVAGQWMPQAIAKDIDLGLELGDAIVRGNAFLLRELISNLVENAITYSSAGGRVTVRTRARGSGVAIEVEDEGTGIPADERANVLRRFYRVPGALGSGSGLGLAIVREIAELHGAHVHIEEPASGKGTLVCIRFDPAHLETSA